MSSLGISQLSLIAVITREVEIFPSNRWLFQHWSLMGPAEVHVYVG